jgi:putative ABC transport system substrate-binding protein
MTRSGTRNGASARVVSRRRVLAGAIALPLPLAPAIAQPVGPPTVGYLGAETPALFAGRVRAFNQGLRETGWVAGRDVLIEYRWAEGHHDRLSELAEQLVALDPKVIAAPGGVSAGLAAKAATDTIPIVFQTGADPVLAGLVEDMDHPGGNVTGCTTLNAVASPERLELLHTVLPKADAHGLLVNPTNPASAEAALKRLEDMAQRLKVEIVTLNASSENDFDEVCAAARQMQLGGFVVSAEIFFSLRARKLAQRTLHHRVPAIHLARAFAVAGGLMSYGGSILDSHRQAGVMVGRILNGARPAEMPVQRAAKFDLVLNKKTAKALDLVIPPSVIGRATELIE